MSYSNHTSYGYPINEDYYAENYQGYVGDYFDDAYSDIHHYQTNTVTPHASKVATIPAQQHYPTESATPYAHKLPAIPAHQPLVDTSRIQHHSAPYLQQNYRQQPHHPHCDTRSEFYCTSSASQPVTSFQTPIYGNYEAHQHFAHTRLSKESDYTRRPTTAAKRYPVTFGTPKYYRRPTVSNTLYKRPSALCLPVASQPDPAIYRKPRKVINYDSYAQAPQGISPRLAKKQQQQAHILPHKMHSEGDVNISSLDELFDKVESQEAPKMSRSKGDIAKISMFLRPKIPPSLKARQEKQRLKSKAASLESSAKVKISEKKDMDIHEVTTDSLERLLNQLKKCELSIGNTADNIMAKTSYWMKEDNKDKGDANDQNVNHNEESPAQASSTAKSFNYRDLVDRTDFDSTSSIQDITKKLLSSASSSSQRPRSTPPKPTVLDDNCALELHRSKSYIVNLIDRALSKELGTIPGERTKREFDNMSPKKAIDLVNRHTKTPQDISVEITSTLADSIISNATAPGTPAPGTPLSQRSSNVSSKVCCCAEEPAYIKQLKQLRWGHLKHIQREVKRLEDLERFLDSCSIATIPED